MFVSGGEHSHSHAHTDSGSHSHSIEELFVGLSILFGIVVFLLVEKIGRFVEERSGGADSWGHGQHHHHSNKSEPLQDINGDEDGKISETTSGETSLRKKLETMKEPCG